MKSVTEILMLAGLIAVSGFSETVTAVYDDFSSGDLSKWTYTSATGDPGKTPPLVQSGVVVWEAHVVGGWERDYLVSTKSDFNLAASTNDPLRLSFDVVSIVQKTGSALYDYITLGWMDGDGDLLQARLLSKPDGSTPYEAAVQFFFKGTQIGTTTWFADLPCQAGDTLAMVYDGSSLSLRRDRSGTIDTLSSTSFSTSSFAGPGSICFGTNIELLENSTSYTIDNIATQTPVSEPAESGFTVSLVGKNIRAVHADFPGGNIIVEEIDGNVAKLRPDLSNTSTWWFYWYFDAMGVADQEMVFDFTSAGTGSQSVIGVRGPAISRDGGATWQWLGRETVTETSLKTAFTYRFGPEETAVRFSFAMPYLESNLNRFIQANSTNACFRKDILCQSREGRDVERLHLGCISGEPRFKVLFTCRHHACEMMASYAVEGLMEAILRDTEAGRWLRENVEIVVVPFVDKDGVENGDQGKNRIPYDHVLDYRDVCIYPEPAALMNFIQNWADSKLMFAVDVHDPYIRGEFSDVIMSPDHWRGEENWAVEEQFLAVLESVQTGPLHFDLSDSQRFTSWDGSTEPTGPTPNLFTTWVRDIPGLEFSCPMELPYATAGGGEVNQETAQLFGYDLCEAMYVWLKQRSAE